MKQIQVSTQLALVDDEDYYKVNALKWFLDSKGYAYANYKLNGKRTTIRMHHLVMNTIGQRKMYDHRNHNKLDNQKLNLRPCTHQQNMMNKKAVQHYAGKQRPSKYKGVTFYRNRWRMTIKIPNGKTIDKVYLTEDEAARCYDSYATQYFGEFAYLNFPILSS